MKKDILVVTDNTKANWLDGAIKENDRYRFHLLAVGMNPEVVKYYNKDKCEQLSSLDLLDMSNTVQPSQERVRRFVPQFIYEFSRKKLFKGGSLLDLLRVTGKYNLWWFMEMPEKGALRTPFIKRLYFAELIISMVRERRYHELWFDLNEADIKEFICCNSSMFPKTRNLSVGKKCLRFSIIRIL